MASQWREYHQIVNLRPSKRIPFDKYIIKLKNIVDTADYFFKKRNGMFDAMPACWKNLTEEQRRKLAALIGKF